MTSSEQQENNHGIQGNSWTSAQELEQQENWFSALLAYIEAYNQNPTNVEVKNKCTASIQQGLHTVQKLPILEYCSRILTSAPPMHINVLYDIAFSLFILGYHDHAVSGFKAIIKFYPDHQPSHETLVAALFLHADTDTEAFDQLKIWRDHLYAAECEEYSHKADKNDKTRPLKIGYQSAYLLEWETSTTTWPGLFHHIDKKMFKTFVYVDKRDDSGIDIPLIDGVDHVRDVSKLSDEQLSKVIYDDEIDILVDLLGIPYGRLGVFRRQPAPIQIVKGAVSSGIDHADYFIACETTIPDWCFKLYCENVIWMPSCFSSWLPPTSYPDVAPPPFEENGYITFGSFNRLVKLNPTILKSWSEIVLRVPNSVLLLKAGTLDHKVVQEPLLQMFKNFGLDESRIIFLGGSDQYEHLENYGKMDIALDTVPEQGFITSLESLWCGVPVITWQFDRRLLTRCGSAIYHALGMEDMVSHTQERFVESAIKLANDPAKLKQLRTELRPKLANSPICDIEGYSITIQAIYRDIWQHFCDGETPMPVDSKKLLIKPKANILE
jgi:protein O-GlcNAc transferase